MTPVDKLHPKSGKLKPQIGQFQPMGGTNHHGGYHSVNIKTAVELGAQAVFDHQRSHHKCSDGHPELMAET